MKVLRLTETDDVGIALTALAAGDALGIGDLRALEPMAAGHKVALRRIEADEVIDDRVSLWQRVRRQVVRSHRG